MPVGWVSDLGIVFLQTFNFHYVRVSGKQIVYTKQAKYIFLESLLLPWQLVIGIKNYFTYKLSWFLSLYTEDVLFTEVSLKCLVMNSIVSCAIQTEGNVIVIVFMTLNTIHICQTNAYHLYCLKGWVYNKTILLCLIYYSFIWRLLFFFFFAFDSLCLILFPLFIPQLLYFLRL